MVLSAQSAGLTANQVGFFVKPVRDAARATLKPLSYNPTTGEISYDSAARRLSAESSEGEDTDLLGYIKALEARIEALEAERAR